MSSYFDEADRLLRACFEEPDPGFVKHEGAEDDVRWTEFWKRYHQWENKLVEDCLTATRTRRFPPYLRTKIRNIIERRRVFRTSLSLELNEQEAGALLSMRMSFLSSELHSVFHEVATFGGQHRIRHLNDDPGWMARRAPKEQ